MLYGTSRIPPSTSRHPAAACNTSKIIGQRWRWWTTVTSSHTPNRPWDQVEEIQNQLGSKLPAVKWKWINWANEIVCQHSKLLMWQDSQLLGIHESISTYPSWVSHRHPKLVHCSSNKTWTNLVRMISSCSESCKKIGKKLMKIYFRWNWEKIKVFTSNGFTSRDVKMEFQQLTFSQLPKFGPQQLVLQRADHPNVVIQGAP